MLKHDALFNHYVDALIYHVFHSYVWFCKWSILETIMAVVIYPVSIGAGAKILRFRKGHSPALTKGASWLIRLHRRYPFRLRFLWYICFMRSRALRRHHEQRIKDRIRVYYCGAFRDNPRRLGYVAHSRTLCSCWMCGNPRKWHGEVSVQERRAAQSEL